MTQDNWTNFRIALDAARMREQALKRQILEERERVRAMEFVLNSVLDSTSWLGFNRRRFQRLIAEAGKKTSDSGPEATRHAVLLVQARRVLGSK